MDALVIGAGGFAGTYLIRELQSQGKSVVLAKLPHESIRIGGCEVTDLDILNENAVRTLLCSHCPAQIYYLAEQDSVAQSWKDPKDTVDRNIKGLLCLLEAVRSMEEYYPRILLVGSAEEYGSVKGVQTPVREDAPLHPSNPYGVTKACQSSFGSLYARTYGMGIVMVRAFGQIGVGQSPQYFPADLTLQIAEMEAGFREPMVKLANPQARRDFCDVRDAVRAYVMLMERGRAGEVYNVGSGCSVSMQEVLEMLTEQSSIPIAVMQEERRMRSADMPAADITKLWEDTGWTAEYPLEESLRTMLNFNRRNFGLSER